MTHVSALKSMAYVQLVEIVMDLGRPPLARFPSGDLRLADDVISNADLNHAISKVPSLPAPCMQTTYDYKLPQAGRHNLLIQFS